MQGFSQALSLVTTWRPIRPRPQTPPEPRRSACSGSSCPTPAPGEAAASRA